MTERTIIILINLSWQLVIAFAISKLFLTVFNRHSASIRHIVWLCVALSPLILLPMNMTASSIVLLNPTNLHKPSSADFGASEIKIDNLFSKGLENGEEIQNTKADPSAGVELPSDKVSLNKILRYIPLIILILWSIGFGRGIICLVFGTIKIRGLVLRADKVTNKDQISIFSEVSEKLGFSRKVNFLKSSGIQIPFSTGLIRYYVVMPSDMIISDDRLRMILIHELTHLKHFDNFINPICQIAKAIMFFHPLYYLVIRELGLSSEQICDIHAVSIAGVREDYAQCLVDFSKVGTAGFPMGFSAGKNSISKRITSILDEKEVIRMTKKKVAFLLVSFIFIMLVLSSIRLVSSAFAEQFAQGSARLIFSACPPAPFGELGNMDIFTADTSNPNWIQPEAWVRLTDDPGSERSPVWSPDGRKIAFVSEGDVADLWDDEIYVMDADGKNQIRLTKNNDEDTSPTWSPDGKKIAFYRFEQASRIIGIFMMDSDGQNIELITDKGVIIGFPGWSPDGKRIAFNKGNGICVIDVENKKETVLINEKTSYDWWPSWSPDGTKMAFSSDRENHNPVGNKSLWDVYVMNSDGSDQRNVTKSPETSQKPWCWTSDGKIIYGIGSSPWIIDADGNNKQMIRDGGLIDIDWFGPSPVLSVKPVDKLISTWGWLKKAFE